MSAITVRYFALCALLMAGGVDAWAGTEMPVESVTVSGTRLRNSFHKFEDAFVVPTPLGGKIARWQRHICPIVVGQTPNITHFITQHLKSVALAAGAHVETAESCGPNIEIVFTTTPQALMDTVHKKDPLYLGYAESSAELEKLATVTRRSRLGT